jgi:prepilin-type N-terminal cleavage/methylation domain-containing protein
MKTLKLRTRSAAKRAFTLIEIMVATVIMVVLVGLVVQITSEVLKVWTRSSGKLSANAEARIAMDLITQDLETAVFRNNGQQWLRVDAPLLSGGAYAGQTVGLKLFSPALDRPKEDASGAAIPGDVCAIGYRLAYKTSYTNGPSVYALYRRVVDPKTTFDDYLGSAGGEEPSPQESLTSTTLWADGGVNGITADENYLVSNIVAFKVLIYELDPVTQKADLVNADANHVLDSHYAYGGAAEPEVVSTNQLLYADVILTVVSDEGLQMLEHIDKIPETVDEVVALHGEVFTRRVNFMAHPL